ncbi:hypothetical protein XO12_00030 [Marinitoga sp. 1154]|uniref:DUF2202 domain-containing protein n=1 Tax=Marinitoga sp. 1154 TaxID=1643335 RepID=UPI0015863BA9|nr:DUF2202 domain-containing protein [Marinitoga sp. 1154]NUU98572.1 hypothetical protein [Marinitoga sp. 1154]
MKKSILIGLMALLLIAVSFAGGFFNNSSVAVESLPVESLTSNEINGLLQMREEEKLARDVYLTLYDTWGLQTFYNIAQAEQTHMNAVKTILDKYEIEDPITDYTVGVFKNAELQKLYYDLVEEGKKSAIEALKVGATIEDLDIYDLEKLLNETDNQDITLVYNNLKQGSENHMRAFVGTLERYNSTYSAQYISSEELNEILNKSDMNNSSMENSSTQYNSGNSSHMGKGYRGGRK